MEKDLSTWKVKELKDHLRTLGLKLAGNKSELIQRIRSSEASKRRISPKITQSPKRPQSPQRILAGAPELNFQIFLRLDDRSLARACKTSKDAGELCKNDYFWRKRTEHVFGYDLGKYNVGQLSYKIIYNFFKKHRKKSIDLKLVEAARAGYFAIVYYLIEAQDADIYYRHFENEVMVLREAVIGGHLLILKYLEKIGEYDLDFSLLNAAEFKQFDIVKFLIEKGADIYKDNDVYDQSPFSMAASVGALDILKYMIKHKKPEEFRINEVLLNAVESGKLSVVKYLIEEQGVTDNLDNAIIIAALDGNLEIIKYLVEKGGDIHFNNDAALHNAEKQEYDNIVRYIRGSPKKRVKRRTIPT